MAPPTTPDTTICRVALYARVSTGGQSVDAQLAQLRHLVDFPQKPAAILVMAVRERGLAHIARDAVAAGIHWVFLNRC